MGGGERVSYYTGVETGVKGGAREGRTRLSIGYIYSRVP